MVEDTQPQAEGITDTPAPEQTEIETALRPETLDDFVGQPELVSRLRLWLRAAIDRQEPLDHVVLSGPPGLGKTTLANLVATHTGARLHNVNGASVKRPADLIGTLLQLKRGDVLFIDEVHRLPIACEEYLYTAMEDWRIDVTTEKSGTQSLAIQRFTMIGATTRLGLLSAPLRARFRITERLEPYDAESLTTIARASGAKLGLDIDTQAASSIAERCRGTPRRVVTFLSRLRDVVQVNDVSSITVEVCDAVSALLGLDSYGLDAMDRRILQALDSAAGKPIGLTALGQMVNEEGGTIEDSHEPYLVQQGYVLRTKQGRMITDKGRQVCGGVL